MYPQEKVSETIAGIEYALSRIVTSKDNTRETCILLSNMSLDIQRLVVLFGHAERLKRMENLHQEKKMLLRFVSTIEYWARYKNWNELCDSIRDIGHELLGNLESISKMLQGKIHQQRKDKHLRKLVGRKEEKRYREKVRNNRLENQKMISEEIRRRYRR